MSCNRSNGGGMAREYHGMGRRWIVPVPHIKTAESGNKRLHAFCGICGTPIYSSAVENPQSYGLRAGTIRQRAEFSPRRQIWRQSALAWVDALATVPAAQKG
jgi:hypothetical protein